MATLAVRSAIFWRPLVARASSCSLPSVSAAPFYRNESSSTSSPPRQPSQQVLIARGLHTIKGQPGQGQQPDPMSASDPTPTSPANAHRMDKDIPCTMIPGDGVGPELMHSVKEVFKAGGVPVKFEDMFFSELNPYLSVSAEKVVESVQRNGVCLMHYLKTPDTSMTGELGSLNMKFRRGLDLFANVVHVKSLPGVRTRHKDIDFVIIREQTEGEYSALEHESVKGVVESYKIVTREKSRRIAKFAFDWAIKHGRKKVTAVHKANIMKLADGLFLKSCEEMSRLYPNIQFANMIIDNTTMQMVSNPHQFDVLVMPNLYGTIIDNLAAGLIGGAGVCVGASYSANAVVYEPGARHTFSEAVGRNLANPTAMLLCSARMLDHVNLRTHAAMVRNAVGKVLLDGKVKTKDIGGYATTSEFTYAVIQNLQHR